MTAPACPYPLESCRCGARFFFATTHGGRRIPVNPEPDEQRGNLRVHPNPAGGFPVVVVLKTAERFGKTGLYVSHFMDCPLAEKYRGRGRRRTS